MTLATTSSAAHLRGLGRARIGYVLDLALLAAAAGLCVFLFFQGGLEALLGAGLGAALGARTAKTALSGAFAGLFTGALFAAFFHSALAALV